MEYDHHQPRAPSLRDKIKASFYASGCFTCYIQPNSEDDNELRRPVLASRSSSSALIRSIPSRVYELPEGIKEMCASLFTKIGGKPNRRANNTFEFRYDPMSYAQNFDDESVRDDEFPIRNFLARLPPCPTPEKRFEAPVSREIVTCI